MQIDRKAFNLLRREGEIGGDMLPRTRYDYAKTVGDGLGSATIVAPALWVMRQFPEAPLVVRDPDGELVEDHPLSQLFRRPNRFYGGGSLRQAAALDYTITGDAYLEIGRNGRTRLPEILYYQPSYQITPKGSDTELITHYEQSTKMGPRRIEAADMIHFRLGLNPRDQKRGMSPLYCLLREVFTDDEAANFTAAVLRNFGFPGIMISPAEDTGTLGPKQRQTVKDYFRRMFRGDQRGDVLVTRGHLKIDTVDVDLAKLNLAALRAIPEARACAVLGIPSAVVGFGTGMEQTKVGATMKELRELAYENAIIPMQSAWAEELDMRLLPEFETDERFEVAFDNSDVRVLQEDENRHSERLVRQFQGGLILRSEARQELGHDVTPADDVYRTGFADVLIPAGQMQAASQAAASRGDWITKTLRLKGQAERAALNRRLLKDWDSLSRVWAGELERDFEAMADQVVEAWQRVEQETGVLVASRNGHGTKDLERPIEETVDLSLGGITLHAPEYGPHYLRVLRATLGTINAVFTLGVDLDDPLERRVVAEGGTRMGLIDMTAQTREAMYQTLEAARAAGMGPVESARLLRDGISAGPWGSVQTRAMVIARTETKWAQNVSAMAVYTQADTVTGIQVFDAQLGDTDADCEAMAGRIFSVQEAAMIAPLDHPNCTRNFAPVVGDS